MVRLVDVHGNVSPEFDEATVEVHLSHSATSDSPQPIALLHGEASFNLRSQSAERVEVSAGQVTACNPAATRLQPGCTPAAT